jgi:hypothetical protein
MEWSSCVGPTQLCLGVVSLLCSVSVLIISRVYIWQRPQSHPPLSAIEVRSPRHVTFFFLRVEPEVFEVRFFHHVVAQCMELTGYGIHHGVGNHGTVQLIVEIKEGENDVNGNEAVDNVVDDKECILLVRQKCKLERANPGGVNHQKV